MVRAGSDRLQRCPRSASLRLRHLPEGLDGHFIGLEWRPEMRDAVESTREMIDRVVSHRERAVAALVPRLQAEVEDVLLADLNVVGDPSAVHRIAPAAFVEREVGV